MIRQIFHMAALCLCPFLCLHARLAALADTTKSLALQELHGCRTARSILFHLVHQKKGQPGSYCRTSIAGAAEGGRGTQLDFQILGRVWEKIKRLFCHVS